MEPTVLIVILFLYFIYRILKEKPLKETVKSEFILILVGGYIVSLNGQKLIESANAPLFLGISLFTGFLFGLLRGTSVKIYYDQQSKRTVRKGTWISVAIFIAGIVVTHFLVKPLSNDSAMLTSISQTLHMGVSLLGAKIVYKYRLTKQRKYLQ